MRPPSYNEVQLKQNKKIAFFSPDFREELKKGLSTVWLNAKFFFHLNLFL